MKLFYQWIIFIFIFSVQTFARIINIPGEYTTIQQGINASLTGDTVLVENGTYYENINFKGKSIIVCSRYIMDNNLTHISNTIIDGSMSAVTDTGSCVVFDSGENSDAVLFGFTITGGTGTSYSFGGGVAIFREGGGIIIDASAPTIKNNIIINNEAKIISGVNGGGGGGISSMYGNPTIINNIIMQNKASYAAGVVLNWSGGIIRNNIVYQNTGGGQYGTAGIMVWESTPWTAFIENNTIIGNASTSTAGALSVTNSSAYIRNNIIWGNSQQTGQQVTGYQTSIFEYCNTEESYSGTGNISANPDFDSTNFQLHINSPCIDAGNPATLYNDIEDSNNVGFALFPSLGSTRNDIGAFGGQAAKVLPEIDFINGIKKNIKQKLPQSIILNQNYPNPFNLSTKIAFKINNKTNIDLAIYNITGKLIRNLIKNSIMSGENTVEWDGRDNSGKIVSSGIYIYRIKTNAYKAFKTMLLLK